MSVCCKLTKINSIIQYLSHWPEPAIIISEPHQCSLARANTQISRKVCVPLSCRAYHCLWYCGIKWVAYLRQIGMKDFTALSFPRCRVTYTVTTAKTFPITPPRWWYRDSLKRFSSNKRTILEPSPWMWVLQSRQPSIGTCDNIPL